ncbi:glycerol acyltransferase [Pseudonocardiaceae bacterium YIM PH 21723]|nr:glycerol acyltransferase [Pseudonocardiaceae bacterium YIM PH 21723]
MIKQLTALANSAAWLAEQVADQGGRLARDLIPVPPPANLEDRDPEFLARVLPTVRRLTKLYFRAEVEGVEQLPADGPVLMVGNHSGGILSPDTGILIAEIAEKFGVDRLQNTLAHDIVASMPGQQIVRKFGIVPASPVNAKLALEAGSATLVYPGGELDLYRPSWDSSKVDFYGRTGFIRLAMAMDVPIAPTVSIGGQEIALFLSDGKNLADLLGLRKSLRLDALPVTLSLPWGLNFGVPFLPLPSKIKVRVLPPFRVSERFGPGADVDEVYQAILSEIQTTLDEMQAERSLPIVG